MSTLPPESRVALMPLASTALEARSRYSSTDNIRTNESRKQFYLTTFVPKYKLSENPFLIGVSSEDKNVVMASYATYLLTGHTLLCKSILVGTVKRYIAAVSELFLSNQ